MKITPDNYYSPEANREYFTCSQIKTFMVCPSQWLATVQGLYKRPESNALFLGKYYDEALTQPDTFDRFLMDNADKVYTGKKKRSDILKADKAIARVRQDPGFMKYLQGEMQVIIVLEDFHGHPYKAMLDSLDFDELILTDLKTCRGLHQEDWKQLAGGNFIKVHWIAAWKYPMQLALYREAVYQTYGFHPHPYIAAIEKPTDLERSVNYDVFDLLDPMPLRGELLRGIEAMDEMSEMRGKDPMEVNQCGLCDWCLRHKRITQPVPFQYDPRLLDF